MKRLAALLLFLSVFAHAQTPTASLTGLVTDKSGAILPGAKVVARNVHTAIEYSAVADAHGAYEFLQLPPDVYDIQAAFSGFKVEVQQGVVLQVDQRARTDFSLTLGEASDTVEVSSRAAITDTQSSEVGTVIENKLVSELPLNNRSFYSLALLAPGVSPPSQNSTLGYRGGFNVAGSKETWNNFTLNGVDDNDEAIDGPSYRPSVEAIQEFKLLTGIYSAEYGRTSGGQVVVVTKSGSNGYHGDAFEFLRNQITDAKNYFTPAGQTPPFHRNQFGGTLGGPILKDKTFFFVNYEGLRLKQQTIALSTVPTTDMVNGNFTSLLSLPTPIHVRNPYTHADFTTPNVIDPSFKDALGVDLASFYPAPTKATAPGFAPTNNYNFSQTATESLNEFAVRVDHTFSSRDSLYANYNYFDDPTFVPGNNQCGPYYIPGFGCIDGLTTQLAMISETHVFTPKLLNQVRLNFERFRQSGIQQDVTANFPGLPGAFSYTAANNTGLPNTSVTGYSTFGGATNMPQQRFDNTYQAIDSVSYEIGRHVLKLGGDYRFADSLDNTIYTGRGSLTFTASTAAATSGYAFADVLLGLPTTTTRNPSAVELRPYHHNYSLFGQDDWKVSPSLTLNLGLRWEYDSPLRDLKNNLSGFNAATGTIIVAGQNGVGTNLSKEDLNNFAPRIGFSWQPYHTASTVVRGGFGVFYNTPVLLQGFVNVLDQYPIRNPQTFSATVASPILLENAFPTGVPANSASSRTATGIDPNSVIPYVDEWSLGVQQALTSNTIFELTYVGSKGTKLPTEININQPTPGPGTVAQVNARRPYQTPFAGLTFGNVTYLRTEGNSSYNSLQARLQRNYTNGFSFLVAYTYSKSLDEGAGYEASSVSSKQLPQDSLNPRGERGPSDFDLRHRFVVSPVYDLPFGKKGKYLRSGWASYLVGGWQVSGIFTAQSGEPFTAYYSTNNSNTSEGSDRPNLIGNPNTGPKAVTQWLNLSAFQNAPAGTYGNESRNALVGPRYVDVDASIVRTFPIHNQIGLQIRAESFNLANHPNFFNPTGAYGTTSFGTLTQANDPREFQFAAKLFF